ncbi:hypothetical protein Tco_0419383 [Tanacetum coccineum]
MTNHNEPLAHCWDVIVPKEPEQNMLVGSYQDLIVLNTGLQYETHHIARNKPQWAAATVAAVRPAKDITTPLLIIMAQQQHEADVHPDELCPLNKGYDLMDAKKKVDLKHVQCPRESKILTYIIKNHPLRFSIAASSSVPWIYMAQFWHTLKEDKSKYRLSIGIYNGVKDTIEFQDYWSSAAKANVMQNILQMLNNTCHWMGPTAVIDNANVVLFCQQHSCGLYGVTMGRTLLFASSSNIFDSNIFNSRRHKNKVGMKIPDWMITDEMKQTEHYRMYTEVFGIDVPLTQSQPTESTHGTHRTTSAPRSPNPDKEVAESSAPSRSTVIRLRLPERRSTRLTPPAPVPTVDKADEMILQDTLQVSLAEHKSHEEQEARENVALVDEHLASEEIEKMVEEQENISDKESPEVEIAKEKEVEITQETEVEITQETQAVDITKFIIPVNVTDEDEEITDEVYDLKRRQKGKNVEETRSSPIPTPIRSPRIHTNLVSLDTKKLQELTDTPHTTSSSSSPYKKLTKTNRLLSLFKTKPTRFKRYKSFFHELQGRYGYLFAHLWARFMPRKSFDTLADNLHDVMVETLPTIVDKHVKKQVMKQVMKQVPEQVQIQVLVYVVEGLILERQKTKEETERLIAKAILQERGNIQAQISTQIDNAIAIVIPSQVEVSVRNYMSGHILHVHPAQSQTSSVPKQQYQLTPAIHLRDQDDPYDDAYPEGETSAKRQKTSEYEAYISGSGQVFQEE